MKKVKPILLLLIAFFTWNMSVVAQNPKETKWTQKSAAKWFQSREWANGMSLKAHPSVNQLEFAKQYHLNKPYWDLAFAWLKNNNLETVLPGKYFLDSLNVTVSVAEGASTKPFEQTSWEGHSKYIDIQYISKGKEKMGIAPFSKTTVVNPYNSTKDVGFYNLPEVDAQYCLAEPGTFLIFFPSDAHRPNIKVADCDTVKKIVFKIKANTAVDPIQREKDEAIKLQNPAK